MSWLLKRSIISWYCSLLETLRCLMRFLVWSRLSHKTYALVAELICRKIDQHRRHVSDEDLKYGPSISNLIGSETSVSFQKPNNYNILLLCVGSSEHLERLLIVSPPLLFKLSVGNKPFVHWKSLNGNWKIFLSLIIRNSIFIDILASSLSAVGARRTNYSSGEIPGVLCWNLMNCIPKFWAEFSESRFKNTGLLLNNFQSESPWSME